MWSELGIHFVQNLQTIQKRMLSLDKSNYFRVSFSTKLRSYTYLSVILLSRKEENDWVAKLDIWNGRKLTSAVAEDEIFIKSEKWYTVSCLVILEVPE